VLYYDPSPGKSLTADAYTCGFAATRESSPSDLQGPITESRVTSSLQWQDMWQRPDWRRDTLHNRISFLDDVEIRGLLECATVRPLTHVMIQRPEPVLRLDPQVLPNANTPRRNLPLIDLRILEPDHTEVTPEYRYIRSVKANHCDVESDICLCDVVAKEIGRMS